MSVECEKCGADIPGHARETMRYYSALVNGGEVCGLCSRGDMSVSVDYVVCRDCFDVFAGMAGATEFPDDVARVERLAAGFDGYMIDLPDTEPSFGRYGCDTCDTGLAGDRFDVFVYRR